MKFSTHYSDLYVLPENEQEKEKILEYCKNKGYGYKNSFSNIEGQDWYGKTFIEIPFLACEQTKIKNFVAGE